MPTIIFMGNEYSLKTFYEDTLEYLFEKHMPHTPENPNFHLSEKMELSSWEAGAFLEGELEDR